jgi:hypothetical protein
MKMIPSNPLLGREGERRIKNKKWWLILLTDGVSSVIFFRQIP